jgi:hypothetical protein
MYDACLEEMDGKEIWVDYSWLYKGCINDLYFNWMYGMWTGRDPSIRQMLQEGTQFRKLHTLEMDKKFELVII